jgi:cytosine deaminase
MNTDNITVTASGEVSVKKVAFAGSTGTLDLTLGNGKVLAVKPGNGEAQWLCLPPLVDKHVHANRAFSLAGTRPESFEHSIQLAYELFSRFTAADYRRQAGLLFERVFGNGTTGLRTHADIDTLAGLAALQGTLEARREVTDRMDIEVVAFASSRLDPAGADGVPLLEEAIAMGADLLGAVPVLYPEPARSIDVLLDLAAEHGVPVDVHLDEHLDAGNSWSEYLADAVLARDYRDRVTLSHGCALSVLAAADRGRVIDKIRQAGITVIALPLTNLYLQDRTAAEPRRRGLTCVRELLAAGVEVRFATDNVRDMFYPYGDGDLLDTAYAGMLAGQMDDTRNLVRAICDGRIRLEVGDNADMVLIPGREFDEVLSTRAHPRRVLRMGRVMTGP